MNHYVYTTEARIWREAVQRILAETRIGENLSAEKKIVIKPNLVEALEPPITTPVQLVEEVIIFLQRTRPDCEILIGEGTGSVEYDTFHCFDYLGYTQMAQRRGVRLLDLNLEPLVRKERTEYKRLPELYLPGILDEAFLLSIPVLKAHSLAGVTLAMKNMMGCVPPAHYRKGGCWGKSSFHNGLHDAILDLNRYRCPDYTLLDASVGMAEAHLWGAHCDPPVGRLAGSWDVVAIDSYGASLLGRSWEEISHIKRADGVLGRADFEIIEL